MDLDIDCLWRNIMMFTELSTLNQINPPTIIVSLKKKTETNKDRLQNQILNRQDKYSQ